jgi:hypothetical protein
MKTFFDWLPLLAAYLRSAVAQEPDCSNGTALMLPPLERRGMERLKPRVPGQASSEWSRRQDTPLQY